MADVIVTFRVMLESPEVDADDVKEEVVEAVENYGGKVGKTEIEPIAYGINSIKVIFAINESRGSTEPLEKEISDIEGVNSVDVVDVRRGIG